MSENALLLETIALSTGQNSVDSAIQCLNNEGLIESLYARKDETVFFLSLLLFCKVRTNTTN